MLNKVSYIKLASLIIDEIKSIKLSYQIGEKVDIKQLISTNNLTIGFYIGSEKTLKLALDVSQLQGLNVFILKNRFNQHLLKNIHCNRVVVLDIKQYDTLNLILQFDIFVPVNMTQELIYSYNLTGKSAFHNNPLFDFYTWKQTYEKAFIQFMKTDNKLFYENIYESNFSGIKSPYDMFYRTVNGLLPDDVILNIWESSSISRRKFFLFLMLYMLLFPLQLEPYMD